MQMKSNFSKKSNYPFDLNVFVFSEVTEVICFTIYFLRFIVPQSAPARISIPHRICGQEMLSPKIIIAILTPRRGVVDIISPIVMGVTRPITLK